MSQSAAVVGVGGRGLDGLVASRTSAGSGSWFALADDQDVDQVADFVGGQVEQVAPVGVARGRGGLAGVGDEDGEHGEGEHGQHGVAVPADPAADLVVVESDLAFRGLELSSTAQRIPATRIRRCSGASEGTQHR
jgi:hypothetical protein